MIEETICFPSRFGEDEQVVWCGGSSKPIEFQGRIPNFEKLPSPDPSLKKVEVYLDMCASELLTAKTPETWGVLRFRDFSPLGI